MKIAPHSNVNRDRFKLSLKELEIFYGLPRDVKLCNICNISNQQPMSSNEYSHSFESTKNTLEFNSEGVCRACRFNKLKSSGEIDWIEREAELQELCNQFRKTDS